MPSGTRRHREQLEAKFYLDDGPRQAIEDADAADWFRAIDEKQLGTFGIRSLARIDVNTPLPAPLEIAAWSARFTLLDYAAWRQRDTLARALLRAGAEPVPGSRAEIAAMPERQQVQLPTHPRKSEQYLWYIKQNVFRTITTSGRCSVAARSPDLHSGSILRSSSHVVGPSVPTQGYRI